MFISKFLICLKIKGFRDLSLNFDKNKSLLFEFMCDSLLSSRLITEVKELDSLVYQKLPNKFSKDYP